MQGINARALVLGVVLAYSIGRVVNQVRHLIWLERLDQDLAGWGSE